MTEAYCKAFASIEDVDEKDYGPNGGFTAVLSTPSEDRDGDKLLREEWKDFTQERYPLDMDHGMSVAQTIGSFRPYFDGQKMMMEANFAGDPESQRVRGLVMPDPATGIRHIQSVSVAFMVDRTKKSGEPKRELLNAGVVAIPSNRDAVILASKAASALKDAFSDDFEGDVPDEVKEAVLETLGVKNEKPEGEAADEAEAGGVHVNVHARLNEDSAKQVQDQLQSMLDAFTKGLEDAVTKAAATASGIGGDGALVQAIHDASSHLGAACPVIEVTDEGSGADDGANKSTDEEEVETKDLDAFEKALDEALSPDESPAEAAAATDEVPAPADDAADAKAKRERALRLMQMAAELNS